MSEFAAEVDQIDLGPGRIRGLFVKTASGRKPGLTNEQIFQQLGLAMGDAYQAMAHIVGDNPSARNQFSAALDQILVRRKEYIGMLSSGLLGNSGRRS